MASLLTKKQLCDQCKVETNQKLHRKISTSGAVMVGWVCTVCNCWVKSKTGGIWIPHELLERYNVDITRLPFKTERRGPSDQTMSLFPV